MDVLYLPALFVLALIAHRMWQVGLTRMARAAPVSISRLFPARVRPLPYARGLAEAVAGATLGLLVLILSLNLLAPAAESALTHLTSQIN